jgi:hypothetical protein
LDDFEGVGDGEGWGIGFGGELGEDFQEAFAVSNADGDVGLGVIGFDCREERGIAGHTVCRYLVR